MCDSSFYFTSKPAGSKSGGQLHIIQLTYQLTFLPQSVQNIAPGASFAPHPVQNSEVCCSTGVPQTVQNAAPPSGVPHFTQNPPD